MCKHFKIPSNLKNTNHKWSKIAHAWKNQTRRQKFQNNYFDKLKFHNFVYGDIFDGLDYLDSGSCVAGLKEGTVGWGKKNMKTWKDLHLLELSETPGPKRILNKISPSSLRWGLGLPKTVIKNKFIETHPCTFRCVNELREKEKPSLVYSVVFGSIIPGWFTMCSGQILNRRRLFGNVVYRRGWRIKNELK